ncbi:Fe(3+)-hydroxamate ABC transporter permease FhuB [Pseudomonas sp. 7P_10.2_Bac1]|uniref:Fe(3+)-hydroxamate ABC transporter permease FhuB n=1 Tax=Pseudomonas sp. 7P_10.2_Bac1 TaxID=2971614 RepID=UPI0021C575E9|nr:Fe(3+)-hydroxamate ABC transporter permease FhuB [Pseudomonas sp. 7P_10.2_Bac1]MCU1726000.1 Fe(3+)-hydroxamate ABC transporter permease FhuB [Pseudomonas sp. 7P_10.2_Bac1]
MMAPLAKPRAGLYPTPTGPQAHTRWWPVLGILALLVLALSASNLAILLPVDQWWVALTAPDIAQIHQVIVHDSWLPRLMTGALGGALLGLSGYLFQQVLRNPLAEPMTLGVSCGAQLALTCATLWAPSLLASSFGSSLGVALFGAVASAALVLGMAGTAGFTPVRISVCGLTVTLFLGAVTTTLQLFHAPYLRSLFIWGAGSLAQQGWSNTQLLAMLLSVGLVASVLLHRALALLELGDDSARNLGLAPQRSRLLVLAIAVGLSGAVVSAIGVIGFIGLAAPALARLLGARRLTRRLWLSPLCGALLLATADQGVQALNRVLGIAVPTGAITALVGAPLMLLLMLRLPAAAPGASRGTALLISLRLQPHFKRHCLLVMLSVPVALALSATLSPGPHGWHVSTGHELQALVTWRLPRAIAAMAAGMLLAVSGTLLQRLTRNPLASPEMLGVSSGASLGLVVLVLGGAQMSHLTQMAASASGALLALAAVLWFTRRGHFAGESVLLTGITLGAVLQAALSAVIANGGDRATALLTWMAGSTYGLDNSDAGFAAGMALLLCAATPACHRVLGLLGLGETTARALGLGTRIARLLLLLLIALQTACATLVVGPLSFIGLIAPHLALLLGARTPMQQVTLALPVAASAMLLADWLGRTTLMPREVPAGMIVTLIGAPYLLWLLSRRQAR